jgi:phage FluMu gp28-like protein
MTPDAALPDMMPGLEARHVLLGYQQALLATTSQHQLVVCEKSRRIGMTWAVAADAVLTSAAQKGAGGMDTLYIGYNLDMAREFIDTCASFARSFAGAAVQVGEFMWRDPATRAGEEDRNIQAFRINFAQFEVVALTSKPRSLRGRQGYVIFDEAAFHDALDEMLKAALALLIWGGKVLVISTHDGADNPFNVLVQDIREGKRKGKVVRVTFDDALEAGLYRRICLVAGKIWSQAAEAQWRAEIYGFYGEAAAEELDCIPQQGSGAYLTRAMIEACMVIEQKVLRLTGPVDLLQRDAHAPGTARALVDDFFEEQVLPCLLRFAEGRRSYVGQDFARSSDLTVLAIGQDGPQAQLLVPVIIELANIPFAEQEHLMRRIIRLLPAFAGADLDARGNGQMLAENLMRHFGATLIRCVMATEKIYLERMPRVKGRLEDRSILLPRDGHILDDLRCVKLIRGIPKIDEAKAGKVRGRHGDGAIAIMNLVSAADNPAAPIEFESAGDGLGAGAYADGRASIRRSGFGVVGSGNDFTGWQ